MKKNKVTNNKKEPRKYKDSYFTYFGFAIAFFVLAFTLGKSNGDLPMIIFLSGGIAFIAIGFYTSYKEVTSKNDFKVNNKKK